jgi:hypothetical protein
MCSHNSILYDRNSIKTLFYAGKKPKEMIQILKKKDGKFAAKKTMIYSWYNKFRKEENNISIKPHPPPLYNIDNYFKVLDVMEESRNYSLREISRKTKISTYSVKNIIEKDLHMNKKKKKRVPYTLSPSQKRLRVIKANKIRKILKKKNSIFICV